MDLELSRLRVPPSKGGCPADGGFCPNDESFERLVSDLSVGIAPAVQSGAATLGLRGFSIALSMSITPISGRHWIQGSAGPDPTQAFNPEPDGALAWNRLEVRKGLPFGLEIGGMLGHGVDTSMWVFSGELRAALFEGYRSGLGALPDVAVRGVFQTLTGSEQLSMQTWSFDVTLSKPFVAFGRHRLTPIVALQALLVDASTRPVDLTPDTSAWDVCGAAAPDSDDPKLPATETCGSAEAAQDLENTVTFADVHQTRIRAFLGLEEAYGPFSFAFTLGFDLTVPQRSADIADRVDSDLPRALTLHFVAGLRY
ncbi:MAG TPA: hypothetical protein VJR89_25215 [Polyangiales bacterium]|nr:hypothetical protein [Polyangiales bacterium]